MPSKHRKLLCRSSTARAGVVAQLREIPTDPAAVKRPHPVAEVDNETITQTRATESALRHGNPRSRIPIIVVGVATWTCTITGSQQAVVGLRDCYENGSLVGIRTSTYDVDDYSSTRSSDGVLWPMPAHLLSLLH